VTPLNIRKLILFHWLVLVPLAATAEERPWLETERRIEKLEYAFEWFENSYGRVPDETTWFDELIGGSGVVTNDKRLQFMEPSETDDAWGNRLVVTIPGVRGRHGVDICSYGEDGASATTGADADDVNNWDDNRNWRDYYETKYQWEIFADDYAGPVGLVVFLGMLLFLGIRFGYVMPTKWPAQISAAVRRARAAARSAYDSQVAPTTSPSIVDGVKPWPRLVRELVLIAMLLVLFYVSFVVVNIGHAALILGRNVVFAEGTGVLRLIRLGLRLEPEWKNLPQGRDFLNFCVAGLLWMTLGSVYMAFIEFRGPKLFPRLYNKVFRGVLDRKMVDPKASVSAEGGSGEDANVD